MAEKPIVLITGSSGYLGGAIVRRLADRYTLVGFDRPGGKAPPECARQIAMDLGSDKSVGKAVDELCKEFGSRIASVVHLAAYYDISGEPNPLYNKITVQGTRRLIEALKDLSSSSSSPAPCSSTGRPTCRTRGSTRNGPSIRSGPTPHPR
jgi:nucleoside-diphosphate-sugar epimerase